TVCNGHTELCNRSYGNVRFTHDSYAFSSDPLALARNQQVDILTQLVLGVRLLQAQSHMFNGVLHFCHTSMYLLLFNGGTVADYLSKVKTFLDNNPTEILTLLLTNPEGVSVETVWDPIFQHSGIAALAYVPPSLPVKQSDWPTLGELIQMGKRVIVFMDFNSNTTAAPYILPEFEMIWETPFDVTNSSFTCTIDRINGPLSQTDHMNLLNHYLDLGFLNDTITIPDFIDSNTTNSVSSLIAGSNACVSLNGNRNANFLMLDWVDIGDAFNASERLNMGITNKGEVTLISHSAAAAWIIFLALTYSIMHP
ncbi:PLC-like phosphodiesterase, partial [Hysterangium stoloniferum]